MPSFGTSGFGVSRPRFYFSVYPVAFFFFPVPVVWWVVFWGGVQGASFSHPAALRIRPLHVFPRRVAHQLCLELYRSTIRREAGVAYAAGRQSDQEGWNEKSCSFWVACSLFFGFRLGSAQFFRAGRLRQHHRYRYRRSGQRRRRRKITVTSLTKTTSYEASSNES